MPEVPPGAPAHDSGTLPENPALLSAQLGVLDDARVGGLDALWLVFAAEIDPLGVEPAAFAVTLSDGRRAPIAAATVSPANESDENRTVVLFGDFVDGPVHAVHLRVSGRIHAEDGRRFSELGAEIDAGTAGPTLVLAEVLASGPRSCPSAGAVVRTYWSEAVDGIEDDDRARIRLGEGEGATPLGFDDVEAEPDNVVDLCFSRLSSAGRLNIAAGTVVSKTHGSNAAIDRPLGG